MADNSSLQLETLNKQYDLILKQYNKATNDYLQLTKQVIKTQPQPKTEKQCTDMGGSSFASCSDSGQTYCCGVCGGTSECSSNSGLEYCACTNNYAKQEEFLLKLVSKLNDALTSVGNQITGMNQQLAPELRKSLIKAHIGEEKLKIDLTELNIEKDKINTLLKSIGDLNTSHTDSSIQVDSFYYGYIVFIIITLLCILGVVMLGSLMKKNNVQKGGIQRR